jgi:hypothetical protein
MPQQVFNTAQPALTKTLTSIEKITTSNSGNGNKASFIKGLSLDMHRVK